MTDENTPPETPPAPTDHLFDAPADTADEYATGHAVYDRVLGRFVGPVSRDGKPGSRDVKALVGDHAHKIVAV